MKVVVFVFLNKVPISYFSIEMINCNRHWITIEMAIRDEKTLIPLLLLIIAIRNAKLVNLRIQKVIEFKKKKKIYIYIYSIASDEIP